MILILLAANVVIYLVMAVSLHGTAFDARQLLAWGGNLGALTLSGQAWRLFSAMFLHANLQHIFGNMVLLAITGPMVEARVGRTTTLICYLLCGLIGSLCSAFGHPEVVSVGASGAIAGLLGIMVPLYFVPGTVAVPGAWLLQTIVINAAYSFAPGVDALAHLGGFGSGLICGALLAFTRRASGASSA